MKTKSMEILLVDDHTLFRSAVHLMIDKFKLNTRVHEADSAHAAQEVLKRQHIDIMFLDIQMADVSGLEFLKELRSVNKIIRVIMLTQFADHSLISYAYRCGANGFLLKSCSVLELKSSINGADLIAEEFRADAKPLLKKQNKLDISPRELQVMSLLKRGQSNKEIASTLGLSLYTIESYRKNLLKKTGSRNTVDLISLGYRVGILHDL